MSSFHIHDVKDIAHGPGL